MFNKKGSISISINMIVVVVLAFVMLGLMLTLGRNIVMNAGGAADGILGQTEAEIQEALIRSDVPLYFSQTEYEVGFGDKATLNFGVKNVEPSDANLIVKIEYVDPSTGAATDLIPGKVADANTGGSFFWPKISQKFAAGEDKVLDVQYRAPREKTTYIFKFKLEDGLGDIRSEQIIYINVI